MDCLEIILKLANNAFYSIKEYFGVLPKIKQQKGIKSTTCRYCDKYSSKFCHIYKESVDPHYIACIYAEERGYLKKRKKRYILKKVKKKRRK